MYSSSWIAHAPQILTNPWISLGHIEDGSESCVDYSPHPNLTVLIMKCAKGPINGSSHITPRNTGYVVDIYYKCSNVCSSYCVVLLEKLKIKLKPGEASAPPTILC